MPLHVSSICVHRQEVRIVLYRLWYHHTQTSECSKFTKITKITKMQFCKYEHVVVKYLQICSLIILVISVILVNSVVSVC